MIWAILLGLIKYWEDFCKCSRKRIWEIWELIVFSKLELVSWIWGFMRVPRDKREILGFRGYSGFNWEYSGSKPTFVLECICVNCKPQGIREEGEIQDLES